MASVLKFIQLTFCEGSGNTHWKCEEACLLARAYRLQKTTITAVKTLQIHQSKAIVRENTDSARQISDYCIAPQRLLKPEILWEQYFLRHRRHSKCVFHKPTHMINASNTQAEKPFYYLINQVAKHITLFSEFEEQVNWKKPLNKIKRKYFL